jgi:hypothetical protein
MYLHLKQSTVWRICLLPFLFAPGCEEPRHVPGSPRAAASSEASAPSNKQGVANGVIQPREILGRRTQDIRDAKAELQKGVREGSTKITAKDPITLPGNAYVTIVGRSSILQIQHALDLFRAANERYPKDFPEFKAEIIQANNIALPTLPYYQEYGYNADEHRLIILEYPDRKAALQKQDDARYGR